MSDKRTVSSTSTKGKGSAIARPATQPTSAIAEAAIVAPDSSDEDIFILAGKLEELLKGKSNKTCLKVMDMVGSLHGIRAIPRDRPIGQSTAGTTRVVPVAAKPKKGLPTPPAAWKQTSAYKHLNERREEKIKILKSLPSGESVYRPIHIEELREIERELKSLRSSTPGFH
jgi:tetrahydromethanopterin S-methyltransferase subunit H